MKKSLLCVMMALMTLITNAQSWNFATVSDSDIELLNSDNSGWTHDTESGNDRYNIASSIESQPIAVAGTELEYAKGLLFTAAGGNLRVDVKGKRMWLGGSSKVVIPNVAAEKVVKVIAKSSKTGVSRGLNVSENVKPTSGKFNDISADQVINVGEVQTTGDIVLTCNGAMYIYEISIEDVDTDEEGEGTPDPTPASSLKDNSTSANASKNQVVINTVTYGPRYFNTDEVTSIDVDDKNAITVNQVAGNYTYQDAVTEIKFRKASSGQSGVIENVEGKVVITEAKGWFESAYVKFEPFAGAKTYNVYIKGGNYAQYTKIDEQLVRNYGTYGRADVLGLVAASDYSIKVVPVNEAGTEMAGNANEATALAAVNYDRSGFAHKGRTEGVGAYNNDGSLKAGAHVVYITKNNAKTVSLDIATNSNGKTETYTGFQQIIYGYQKGDNNGSYEKVPLCIRIIGTISASDCDEFLSSAEGIQIKGAKSYMPMNITIEGVGDDATTKGFGFLIRSAASIELRNFANMLCMDDAVSIDTENSNIWVHNLDLFYGNAGGDADQAKGDGTIDMKGDSKYITVSYNHLWDSGKASLCGMKSESGPNWITYHHNWFDHSDSRHPRIRTMSVHVYNNYYDGNAKYGIGAAYRSNAFVEKNYFRNCKYPMLISKQGSDVATDAKGTFSGEDGGMIKSFGNKIVGAIRYTTYQQNATEFDAYEAKTRDEQVPSSVIAKQGGRGYDNFDTDASLFYTYEPDAADDVPAIITGWLGAGRMNHGDFQWVFDNATEDANYAVIAGLKSALQSYKTTLVGIFGDENAQSGEQGNDNPGGGQGGEQGGGQGGGTIEGTVLCTFETSAPSSSLFTVSGNYSNSKGTATVDERTLSVCLKMESTTSVRFTLSQPMVMTLYFADSETASIKVDDTEKTSATSTYSQTLEAGIHELKKADSRNLFAIKLVPVE